MNFADAAEHLLSLLWQTTWQGTLFAVCVAASCVLFRVSATHRALLWLLVCLKFVLGFAWVLCFGDSSPLSLVIPLPVAATVRQVAPTGTPAFPFTALLAVWGIGVFLGMAWLVVRAKLTADAVRHAVPRGEHFLRDTLTAIGMRLGLMPRRIPTVRETPSVQSSPQVTLWRANPVIVFPKHLLAPSPEALSPEELRFVLAHELAHVRRGDLWVGLLFAVAQVLFFFHPCVYWARHEWEAAREEACDALALRACGTDTPTAPAQYGALLLRLGNGGGSQTGIPSAGIAASPFAGLRRRLRYLETWQQNKGTDTPSLWRLAITAPLLAVFFAPLHLQMLPASQPAVAPVAPIVAVNTPPVAHPIVPRRAVRVASMKTKPSRVRVPRAIVKPEMTVDLQPVAFTKASAPAPQKVAETATPHQQFPVVAIQKPKYIPHTPTVPTATAVPTPTDAPSVALAESLPSSTVVVTPQVTLAPRIARTPIPTTPPISIAATTPKTTDDTPTGITPPGVLAPDPVAVRPATSESATSRPSRVISTGENARPGFPFPLPQPSPSPSPLPLTIPVREPILPHTPNR